jgi:hypothetical protein
MPLISCLKHFKEYLQMAENNPSDEAGPKPIGADLIIPVAAIIFTIYYISTILDMKWEAQVSAFLVGGILLFLCAIFLIKTFLEVRSGKATMSFEALINPISAIPKRAMLFGLTFLYIVLVPYGGFTIVTFAFLALAMLVLSDWQKKRFILMLSGLLAIGGYILFIVIFKRRFPEGPFETFVNPIVKSMLGG